MEPMMGCGKCGELYEVGEKHVCGAKKDKLATIESLQKHIGLLEALLKNHSERIKSLELKVHR